MGEGQQLSLFSDPREGPVQQGPEPVRPPLDRATPLEDAIETYIEALKRGGSSIYTLKAFRSDLLLLGQYSGLDTPITDFTTPGLNRFLHWMLQERGKPCSPKSYARRITTLKSFFSFLTAAKALQKDPAAAVIQRTVNAPLPDVLTDDEVGRVLEAAARQRTHAAHPDARPYLLITLLLQTGIKKSECMGLTLTDVVQDDPRSPKLWIRYENPKMRYKERLLTLTTEWPAVLAEYVVQRRPQAHIFECTARNLEYVLRDVAILSRVPRQKVSFEGLRWTCALSDHRLHMDEDEQRQKLGLSHVTWRETSHKLEKLAGLSVKRND